MFLFSQSESIYEHSDSSVNIFLNEVILESPRFNAIHRSNYLVLRRKVLKVYPYVDSIKQVIEEVNPTFFQMSKKRRLRKYTKMIQKKLFKQFKGSMTKLTRSEGVILSKLIYREFDETSYDLISKYRGAVYSFFWQRIAKLYDGDLKATFDSNQNAEDFFIDHIISNHIN